MDWKLEQQVNARVLKFFGRPPPVKVIPPPVVGLGNLECMPAGHFTSGSTYGRDHWHPDSKPTVKSVPKFVGAFDNGYSFGERLKQKGWKALGSGAYSSVYGKEGSDKVIKITRREDGWIDYCKWAADNGFAGKWAPKLYSYKWVKGKEQDFSITLMERLEQTLNRVEKEHDAHCVESLFTMSVSKDNNMAKLMLDQYSPDLALFAEGLKRQFTHVHSWDFHGGNFMIRKNGDFVVTDPIAYGETKIKQRLRSKDFESKLAA